MTTLHDIKAWPATYASLADGSRTFDIRRNDRDYKPGDKLRIREFDPAKQLYTGHELRRRIAYVFGPGLVDYMSAWPAHVFHALSPGYCVLGLAVRAENDFVPPHQQQKEKIHG